MKRQPIKIYSDKRYAFVFFPTLFIFSLYFLLGLPFAEYSFFGNLGIFLLLIMCVAVSSFGLYTLLSKRYQYFGPKTEEYKNQSDFSSPYSALEDRIELRINSNKVIRYADVISIVATPSILDDDEIFSYWYIEIKDKFNRKIIVDNPDDQDDFFYLFQKDQHVTVNQVPTLEEMRQKYGTVKLFFSYGLLWFSPIRMVLWSK